MTLPTTSPLSTAMTRESGARAINASRAEALSVVDGSVVAVLQNASTASKSTAEPERTFTTSPESSVSDLVVDGRGPEHQRPKGWMGFDHRVL